MIMRKPVHVLLLSDGSISIPLERRSYWREDPHLTELTRSLYWERIGQPFLGQVYYNPRYGSHTGGSALPGVPPEESVILVNPRYVDVSPHPQETLRDLLLHELAHYHLYTLGLIPHSHRHPLFRALMAEWGFSRYSDGQIMATLAPPPRYRYRCPNGHEVLRRRPYRTPHSCGQCTRRYNPAFPLRLVADPEGPPASPRR